MSENWQIALVSIAVTVVLGVVQILFGYLIARWQVKVSMAPAESAPPRAKARQSPSVPTRAARGPFPVKFERRVRPWVMEAILFVPQTVAVYLLFTEYSNPKPLTRAGAIFIAAMVGVILLCVVVRLVMGVYAFVTKTFETMNG